MSKPKKLRIGFEQEEHRDQFLADLRAIGSQAKYFYRRDHRRGRFFADIHVGALDLRRCSVVAKWLMDHRQQWEGGGPICGTGYTEMGKDSLHSATQFSPEWRSWACRICGWTRHQDDSHFVPAEYFIGMINKANEAMTPGASRTRRYMSNLGIETGRMSYGERIAPMPLDDAKKQMEALQKMPKRDRMEALYGTSKPDYWWEAQEVSGRLSPPSGTAEATSYAMQAQVPVTPNPTASFRLADAKSLEELEATADEAYRFFCGLNWQYQTRADQEKAREVLHKLSKALKARDKKKGGRDE